MAFWLAREPHGHDSEYIQRFDPVYWTVNFPRPMMASVTTQGPDELQVDCEFHNKGELAGLIWTSEDTLDHPLLRYDTNRDYSRTTLRFRWVSQGIVPLDQPNGPTLTIEGRDAQGQARTWYIRLWNYATGSAEDAQIVLPFSQLESGYGLPGELIHPGDIDRMFISLVPQGYVANSSESLPARVNGYARMEQITCDGHQPLLLTGDAHVPPHGEQAALGYDDGYNQTPARLLRNIHALGYRGRVLHYVGMSHFFRLEQGEGRLLAASDGTLCTPAHQWHSNFFSAASAMGIKVILSLSYELFAAHCPGAWQQRDANGDPARTGWVPPSALLSPANTQAMAWLQAVAQKFVSLQEQAGLPVLFQIGEPWWWIMPGGQPCLYDDDARAAFGGTPPEIATLRAPLNDAERALLDQAGALLAASTAALAQAVRDHAAGAAEILLLAFTPTILDPEMPEMRRANLPLQWAWPAFDRLQVEDYDWLTAGADASRRMGYTVINDRLGYPVERQDYLSGFVLLADDADQYWPLIDAALDEAEARGIAQRYVWAMPQITRDGYTHLPPSQETSMQAFDDVLYPLSPGSDVTVSPEFSTTIAITASGHERRNTLWSDARLRYDVGPGIRSENELRTLLAFFRARRGAARGFRFADCFDFSSSGMDAAPGPGDQLLGIGDGAQSVFQLRKAYGSEAGGEPQYRPITRPRTDSIIVSVNGILVNDWSYSPGGQIALATAPETDAQVRAGFLFDVPVRFATDRLDIAAVNFAAGEAPSVPLVEIREAE